MTVVFGLCAAIGGTILLCQLVLTLVGLAGHAFDVDVSGDVGHDFGGDFHGDVGADFHGDVATDFHGDVAADFHGDAAGGLHGDAGADVHVDTAGHAGHGEHAHPSTVRIFGVLSFRSVVAALTFFGLAGLAAGSATDSTLTVLAVAAAAGVGAMYGVYWLMRGLYQLRAEGTARVRAALGRHATVYLKIPGHQSGTGKIQINLQNRTMEYLAMTPGDELPTGAKVVVVDVITPDTVEVEPVPEPERVEDA
jgi:hypothetical protein